MENIEKNQQKLEDIQKNKTKPSISGSVESESTSEEGTKILTRKLKLKEYDFQKNKT